MTMATARTQECYCFVGHDDVPGIKLGQPIDPAADGGPGLSLFGVCLDPIDALRDARGPVACRVVIDGDRWTVVASIDATNELFMFACRVAASLLSDARRSGCEPDSRSIAAVAAAIGRWNVPIQESVVQAAEDAVEELFAANLDISLVATAGAMAAAACTGDDPIEAALEALVAGLTGDDVRLDAAILTERSEWLSALLDPVLAVPALV